VIRREIKKIRDVDGVLKIMVCLCISFIIKVNKLIIQTTFFACTVYSLNNSSDIFFLFFELGSVDELRKLLSNKDVYQQFLSSHDEVKIQNNVRC